MNTETSEPNDDLRPEYDLASLLKGGVRGKYAKRFAANSIAVVLEPDVARAFPNARAVNVALRRLIRAESRGRRKARRQSA